MIWGCFAYNKINLIHCIEGILEQVTHKGIVEKAMCPFTKKKVSLGLIFNHDNNSKVTGNSVQVFLIKKKSELAQRKDLNPIKHLWKRTLSVEN